MEGLAIATRKTFFCSLLPDDDSVEYDVVALEEPRRPYYADSGSGRLA